MEAELACGLALCLGLWPRAARWAAMLLLAALVGAALPLVMTGDELSLSFGHLQVDSWLVALIALGLLLLLACWKDPSSQRRERRCAALSSLGLIALVAWFVWLEDWPHSPPPNQSSESYVRLVNDLEPVIEGEKDSARFTFRLTNPSGKAIKDLRIVRHSCSCLGLDITGKELGPGQSVDVLMDANLRTAGGTRQVACEVRGKDAGGHEYAWECSGMIVVLPRIHLDPPEFALEDCEPERSYAREIVLTLRRRAAEADPWTIKTLEGTPKEIAVSVLGREENEEFPGILTSRVRLRLSVRQPVFSGSGFGRVAVAQGDLRREVLAATRWSIANHFVVEPSRVFFSVGEQRQLVQTIALRRKDGSSFRVIDVNSTLPNAQIPQIKPTEKGTVTVLQVVVNAEAAPHFRHGEIQVLTDCPAHQRVSIPVSVMNLGTRKGKGDQQ